MPRCARQKSLESIYHVMCRSISEMPLFRDEDDKEYYLSLLSRYKEMYICSIYAYCLMDTHVHIHFDPKGADISKFMHSTNTAYVRYYNKKYTRHGHVFQERFVSKVLGDEAYNLAVSAYIHNNPGEIEEYNKKEEQYKYSSYGIYIGIRKDTHKLIDKSFMYDIFGGNREEFVRRYMEFVSQHRDIGCLKKLIEDIKEIVKNEYRSERRVILRSGAPSKIIAYISDRLAGETSPKERTIKLQKEYRWFCAYILRVLCGLKYKDICEHLYNITLSGCSIMCSRGYELSIKNQRYKSILGELLDLSPAG